MGPILYIFGVMIIIVGACLLIEPAEQKKKVIKNPIRSLDKENREE